jgi:Helix-turn-helix domain
MVLNRVKTTLFKTIDSLITYLLRCVSISLEAQRMTLLPKQRYFLFTDRAAKRLKLSARTLEKWRVFGQGPAYHKFGSRVVYTLDDLDAWVVAQRRTSTSGGRRDER